MVTRAAILIGNSGGYRNLEHLKSVELDLQNYVNFLLSKAGGEWNQNEITVLYDPSSNELKQVIRKSNSDYCFIVFSGHGYISSYSKEDTICLKDIDLSIEELVTNSHKQTIIIDSCREMEKESDKKLYAELQTETRMFSEGINTRILFDNAIESMPNGILLVFATQANNTAGAFSNLGGYFSYSLIKSGKDWWNNNYKGILRIDKAVEEAEKIMKLKFITNQSPAMAGQVRRLTFPPFAIGKH
jgi:hypothetical protein